MLDVLADKVHPSLRLKHQTAHQRLAKMTQVITDKAAVYGQKMDLLLAQWLEFNARFDETMRWMKSLGDAKPNMASDDDSSVELRTKLLDYKSLDRAMTEERSNIFHLVTRGRQLFQAVTCPVAEKLLTDFADTWVQFSNEVASQVKKYACFQYL